MLVGHKLRDSRFEDEKTAPVASPLAFGYLDVLVDRALALTAMFRVWVSDRRGLGLLMIGRCSSFGTFPCISLVLISNHCVVSRCFK